MPFVLALVVALAVGYPDAAPRASAQPSSARKSAKKPKGHKRRAGKRPDPTRRRRALAHLRKANEYMHAGAYENAIEEYQAAFDLFRRKRSKAKVLFNIGMAYMGKGRNPVPSRDPHQALRNRRRAVADKEKAINHFRDFLAWQRKGRDANEARALVVKLRREIEVEEGLIAADAKSLADQERRERLVVAAANRETRRRRRFRIAGLATSGVGIAVLGVGALFGIRASGLESEVEAATDWNPTFDQKVRDGESAERTMIVLTVVGGAALLTGAALYWHGRGGARSSEQERVTEVGVAVTPTFVAVTAGWRY